MKISDGAVKAAWQGMFEACMKERIMVEPTDTTRAHLEAAFAYYAEHPDELPEGFAYRDPERQRELYEGILRQRGVLNDAPSVVTLSADCNTSDAACATCKGTGYIARPQVPINCPDCGSTNG